MKKDEPVALHLLASHNLSNIHLENARLHRLQTWYTYSHQSVEDLHTSSDCLVKVMAIFECVAMEGISVLQILWMALFFWVPIFVDWAKITHSWGSEFVGIAFSCTILTDSRFFMGTRFCESDPPQKPWKLIPTKIKPSTAKSFYNKCIGIDCAGDDSSEFTCCFFYSHMTAARQMFAWLEKIPDWQGSRRKQAYLRWVIRCLSPASRWRDI